MTDRPIKPDEHKIWQKVARTVTPRREKSARPVPTRDDFGAMLRVPPTRTLTTKPMPQTLDINQDKRIRRGRVTIDAKVDLHDLTQAQAQPTLVNAIIRASNRGHKCLLVVTGKGLRLDGILRRHFPQWIAAPEIRPLIASYAPAHIRHGGSGAWYVFLKTSRSHSVDM